MNRNLSNNKLSIKLLKEQIKLLRHLHVPLEKPKEGDWLSFREESGQTFQEYINSSPIFPREKGNTIYIQLLGEFSISQRKIIMFTAEFISFFFNLPTIIMDEISLSNIPSHAHRIHPSWGNRQILSKYILERILKPRIPKNAAAYVAFTAEDLWPGKGWNFIFGQASLIHRIGIWSIYRNGNADGSKNEFRLSLLRTMKTGAHETAHIFSIKHCISFNCLMNGANSREEADRRPLACCPECMAKICWATRIDPFERYRNLLKFCTKHNLFLEAKFYQNQINALNKR
ncbi:MAG: archaemetzincin [Promethearchaeota archaeon]